MVGAALGQALRKGRLEQAGAGADMAAFSLGKPCFCSSDLLTD